MVRLGRQVRFSVNPFLDHDDLGFNAYASAPAGEGLAVFLELGVELLGPIAPETGFVLNVSDIDAVARELAVPVFADRIRDGFGRREHLGLNRLAEMLRLAHERLSGRFGPARVDRLSLKLNPFRKIAMDAKDPGVTYFSEKFEFAAMHKLWNDRFTTEENVRVFGKCAHPTGHGHNYIVEVTVKTPVDGPDLKTGDVERVVDAQLIALVDHKNLNLDVPVFQDKNPTVENLAVFAWDRLAGKLDPAQLHCVTVWESDRTYCSCYGPSHG